MAGRFDAWAGCVPPGRVEVSGGAGSPRSVCNEVTDAYAHHLDRTASQGHVGRRERSRRRRWVREGKRLDEKHRRNDGCRASFRAVQTAGGGTGPFHVSSHIARLLEVGALHVVTSH